MNIVFAASEAVPYCKTGGLADVIGALPKALSAEGHHLKVFLPLYREIKLQSQIKKAGISFSVPMAGHNQKVELWIDQISPKLSFYFIQSDELFDRAGIYGEKPGVDYPDNALRYAVFNRAVLEACKAIRFQPDVIHCHDWQTGLIPAYLKISYDQDSFFHNTATLFSIHNMAYQGLFPRSALFVTGLPDSVFHPNGMEFYGRINYLKAGLVYCDGISTVSRTYAKEILSGPEYGYGLEGVLQDRRDRLQGVENGLDTMLWDPAADPKVMMPFHANDLKSRAQCKVDLQKNCGFKVDSEIPVLGFVGRLDYQKGVDNLVEITPGLVKQNVQIIFLGLGDPKIKDSLLSLQKKFPEQVYVETGFAEPMAHKIYAGVDIFMMPSRFEPCGLGQLIALRYGAIPVVTPTGGLIDTVKNQLQVSDGTGFISENKSPSSYYEALNHAILQFRNKKTWTLLQKRAMKVDHSWRKSVERYEELYERVLKWRQGK